MKKVKIIVCTLLIAVIPFGCQKNLLEIPNYNDPSFEQVFSSGPDLENAAAGLYNLIFNGHHSFDGVQMMLAVTSDNVSCSWGNAAMRDMSYEPRQAWNNQPSYSNAGNTDYTWSKMYGAIGQANNILKALENGVEVGSGGSGNNRVEAMARFAQGVAYGTLGLIYDRAFWVDEKRTVDESFDAASEYAEVATAAVAYLDQAIALSSGFTIPASWLGTPADYSADDFKRLCNTMAARILAYTPRNKSQNNSVDWGRVKTYAENGIKKDFEIQQDNYVNWYFEAGDYLTFNGWGITDMYTVHMLDKNIPDHYEAPPFVNPPKSTNPQDKRLLKDFEYVPSNWFDAARGYYHFSCYRFSAYDAAYVNADMPLADIKKAENDMLIAEAMMHLNDLSGAAAIINNSTRKTRGEMPDVGEDAAEIAAAIHHERFVEMYVTGTGLQYFEMRKNDLLQKGTPLHLPMPAKSMEALNMPLPFYTYGGVDKADGINTSNGGWR